MIIMKFTPTSYAELSIKMFEELKVRIAPMMASIKGELQKADPADRDEIVMKHVLVLKKRVDEESMPKGVSIDDLMAYEKSAKADIGKYFKAHPEILERIKKLDHDVKEAMRT